MKALRIIRSRYLAWGIVVFAVLLLAGRLAIPFVVPTASIERDIRNAVASWTGARLIVRTRPEFGFWPYPTVTLRDIRLTTPYSPGSDSVELMRADAVSVKFDVLGTLFGKPDFSDFELVRPVVKVAWSADGTLNWRHRGWMTDAIDAVGRSGDGETPAIVHERIGTVSVANGSLTVEDARSNQLQSITDINGTVRWPAIRGSLSASLTGLFNGETARWTFNTDQPLALLAGRNAPIRTSLASEAMTMTFDGVANLADRTFATGRLQLGTPSLGRLLAWRGKEIPAAANIGRINIEANISTADDTAKLDNLQLTLQDAKASGVLDVRLPQEGRPQVGGTLAFDRIDLKALLSAFSPLPDAGDSPGGAIDTAFMSQLGLDLRLSAQTASFAPFTMSDLAAGIRIENGRASFDIGDAVFMDGALSGRIALADQGFQGGGQLQMSLRDADLGRLIGTLALRGPLPAGRGSADIELSTGRPLWAATGADVSGSLRVRMDRGVLPNFNRQAFEALVAKNSFFNLTDAANGTFEFTRADIEASLDGGLVELTRATIEGAEKTLTFSGIIPYRRGSVALAGTIADRQQPEATVTSPSVSFFMGGSWPEPVISPVSILTGEPGQ